MILADDSMDGRATPSPGLERAAAYVAGEFAGSASRRRAMAAATSSGGACLAGSPDTGTRGSSSPAPGGSSRGSGADVRYIGGRSSIDEIIGTTIVTARGRRSPGAASDPALRGRVALLPVDYARPLPADLQERVDRLAASARAVVIVSNRDSATFARRLGGRGRAAADSGFPRRPAGRPGHRAPSARARAGRPQPCRWCAANPAPARDRASGRPAPNLVGVLEGSGPWLRREYVAVTAHVDAVGVRPGAADSI